MTAKLPRYTNNYTADLLTEVLTTLGPTAAVLPPHQLAEILTEALRTGELPTIRKHTLTSGLNGLLTRSDLLDNLTGLETRALAETVAEYIQRKYFLTLRGLDPFHAPRPPATT